LAVGSRAGIENGHTLAPSVGEFSRPFDLRASVKALLLSFFEVRGDGFDAKVVGVDRQYRA
jgi:hypothetical protein